MSNKKRETYRRIGLMIGSPGDATAERQAIADTIDRWNATNKEQGYWIEAVKWETHATPGLDGRPQGMINEELIPQSDCLVAVFRARAGSPTGKEESGTIEEIREFMRLGKYVAVYFYEGPAELKQIDPEQLMKVSAFKKEIQLHGIVGTYTSVADLSATLALHLSAIVQKLAKTGRHPRNAAPTKKPVSRPDRANLLVPRNRKLAREPAIEKKHRGTNAVVDASDRWTLLDSAFVEARTVRQNQDGTITVEVPSRSAQVDSLMASLRPHHFGRGKPIAFAHGNSAWMVTVKALESVSDGTGQVWSATLIPEPIEYGGSHMEMALNQGDKHLSADDIARLRAGRILLNDPPPIDATDHRSNEHTFVEKTMLEALIRGTGTPATVSDCIIRSLYNDRQQADDEFLKIARLGAIFMLRSGGVVEHIQKLSLGPIRNRKLRVDFVGTRRQKNVNVAPTVITIKGDCSLT
jgi:hypothetical protein